MSYIEDIPKYGFGTAFNLEQTPNGMTEANFRQLIEHAVKLGIRHFDCAPLYKTQMIVGDVLKEARVHIPRSEFFITSKLPVNMMRVENIERSIKKTLLDLQLTYLDLYLIHAPFSTKYVSDDEIYPLDNKGNILLDDECEDLLEQAWIKLIELKERGYVKYIGLSNVNQNQLDRLNIIHQVDVVQNEYHLFNQDRLFFDYCEEVEVHYEAYSAFGCPSLASKLNLPIFHKDPTVKRISIENNLTGAEVIMQWLHQQPLSYIIRTDNIIQLEENWNALKKKFLPLNDMIDLDTLNTNARLYYFDEHKNIARHREYPFESMTLRD